jgi:hypothetical protein
MARTSITFRRRSNISAYRLTAVTRSVSSSLPIFGHMASEHNQITFSPPNIVNCLATHLLPGPPAMRGVYKTGSVFQLSSQQQRNSFRKQLIRSRQTVGTASQSASTWGAGLKGMLTDQHSITQERRQSVIRRE